MSAEQNRTGYPSIDKPWLKYYSEEAINAQIPQCTIDTAYAFEYFIVREKQYDFSGWKPFDFETIKNDKIKMVRDGIACLHIKNIGIGPAIHLRMKIENFSEVILPIDYLRPDGEVYVILNFSNPDQSYKTDIIFEYETIRGDKHTQRFHASITWHLDRTNFTLFG